MCKLFPANWTRVDAWPAALGLTLVLALVAVGTSTNLSLTKYQHFSYLAESFLHGKLYFTTLPEPAWQDVALYRGLAYWPQGPLPAVLLLPGVAVADLFGGFFRQGFLQFPFLVVIGIVLYALARRHGLNRQSAGWLTFAFFTSNFLLVALVPTSYHLAHVVAILAVLLSFLEYTNKKRWWLIGLLMGGALLSRTPAGLGMAFFVLEILRGQRENNKVRQLAALLIPFVLVGALFVWYNQARFGSPLEQGYGLQPVIWSAVREARTYGVLSPVHIPGNLYYMFMSMPQPVWRDSVSHVLRFPYVVPDLWGMSLLVTSPYLLYLFTKRKLVNYERHLFIAAGIVAVPILMFHGVGYQQFGYRYALDFLPFLFLALMFVFKQKNSQLSLGVRWLILVSALVNVYLLLALYSQYVAL